MLTIRTCELRVNFKDANRVSEVIWEMLEADSLRSQNRVRINQLCNGDPPYTQQEAEDNRINTNVNFLEMPKVVADARRQFENALLKTKNYFTIRGDYGPKHKRAAWSRMVTNRINRCMKRSLNYTETQREVFATLVLHGVAPKMWTDRSDWKPTFVGIDDFLVPSVTRVKLDNLDHFAVFRSYTPGELYKATHGPTVDKGWKVSHVEKLIATTREEPSTQSNWPNWSFPEKLTEDFKENSGFWVSDAVPTIDTWDFYYLNDDNKWELRRIIDTVTQPGQSYASSKGINELADDFLFVPDGRTYADDLSELVHIQFADGAAVAPFRYHAVRSLGFLLYAVCQLQNRLRCRFNDAVFESMNWYFRNVATEDQEKLQMIQLNNMGVIPDGLTFVTPQERHTINEGLLAAAFTQNRQLIAENSASYVQDADTIGKVGEETATAVMARVNTAAALVNGMLARAYSYQDFEYTEISRRFCLKHNPDKDVKKVRELLEKDGVPDEFFDVDSWEITSDRVMGGGNKALEMAIAQQLLALYPRLDPEPQRITLRNYVTAVADDPPLADELVPENPVRVSDAVHDANLSMGTLMQGIPVAIKTGMNHQEYIETLLTLLGQMVQAVVQSGGMTTPDKVQGFATVAQHIQQHIAIMQQDKSEKSKIKNYTDMLGRIMNEVKAMAQRIQEAAQQQQQQGGGISPEVMAKIQGMMLIDKAKAQVQLQKAQRTAQMKDQQHYQRLQHQQDDHNLEMMQKTEEAALEERKQIRNIFAPE